MMTSSDWISVTLPLICLLGSLLAGLWLQRLVVPRLIRLAATTKSDIDDVLLQELRGSIVLWSLLGGMSLALRTAPIPAEIVRVAGQVVQVVWILSAAWVCASAFSQLVAHFAAKSRRALPMTSLTQHLTRLVILALGLLIILDSLGVRITSLLTALGVGSLAVALGLQDTLANLFAGVYVSISKHISVGDYIRLESGQEGYVADIGWRATTILMLPGNLVIVPNAKLSQSVIVNCSLPNKKLSVRVEVGVDYRSDLEQVERVTCEVAREVMRDVPGGVPGFEPAVLFHTFGDSSVQFTVAMRAKEFAEQYTIKHEFIKRLHARYRREGVDIPFPVRTIYMRQDQPAAPPARAGEDGGRGL